MSGVSTRNHERSLLSRTNGGFDAGYRIAGSIWLEFTRHCWNKLCWVGATIDCIWVWIRQWCGIASVVRSNLPGADDSTRLAGGAPSQQHGALARWFRVYVRLAHRLLPKSFEVVLLADRGNARPGVDAIPQRQTALALSHPHQAQFLFPVSRAMAGSHFCQTESGRGAFGGISVLG